MTEQIVPTQGDQPHQARSLGDFEQADRDRLNELTLAARQPGALLGRDVQLSDADRERFIAIADKVDERLAPIYESEDWTSMMALINEGDNKGVLFSFTAHDGTNIPTWLVDGGEDAVVKKVLRQTEHGTTPGIEVPSGIFNVYHWHATSHELRDLASKSDDALRGRSAKRLGFALRQLGIFIRQTNESDKTQ